MMIRSFILFSASKAILFRSMHNTQSQMTVWFGLATDRYYLDLSFCAFKEELSHSPFPFALATVYINLQKKMIIKFSKASLSKHIIDIYFRNDLFRIDKDILLPMHLYYDQGSQRPFLLPKGEYPVIMDEKNNEIEIMFNLKRPIHLADKQTIEKTAMEVVEQT